MASADNNVNSVTSPSPCAKGCGFFGNPNTQGMCSKCYKETINTSNAPAPTPSFAPIPAVATAPAAPAPPPSSIAAASSAAAALACEPCVAMDESPSAPEESKRKEQTNKSRCWGCNKKIGLLGFKCKCDYLFCSEHRYSDKHECAYDYKAQGKQLLTQANPTISPAKLQGI